MSVLELFCDVDDFMLSFEPQWQACQLAAGKQRERGGHLCETGSTPHGSPALSMKNTG